MNIIGTGTGSLSYGINKEQTVQETCCVVSGAEDDDAGTLVLSVSFDDLTHGKVVVGFTVRSFSTDLTLYDDLNVLTVLCDITNTGSWMSEAGSEASLSVGVTEADGSCRYEGTFTASGLVWQGSGDEGPLAISFSSYCLTMYAQQAMSTSVSDQIGTGPAEMAYSINGGAEMVVNGTAKTVSGALATDVQLDLGPLNEYGDAQIHLAFLIWLFKGPGSYSKLSYFAFYDWTLDTAPLYGGFYTTRGLPPAPDPPQPNLVVAGYASTASGASWVAQLSADLVWHPNTDRDPLISLPPVSLDASLLTVSLQPSDTDSLRQPADARAVARARFARTAAQRGVRIEPSLLRRWE